MPPIVYGLLVGVLLAAGRRSGSLWWEDLWIDVPTRL